MNITLSVPDDVVDRAREAARHQGTSLNAMVRAYLESLSGADDGEVIAEQFRAMWRSRRGRSMSPLHPHEALNAERVERYM